MHCDANSWGLFEAFPDDDVTAAKRVKRQKKDERFIILGQQTHPQDHRIVIDKCQDVTKSSPPQHHYNATWFIIGPRQSYIHFSLSPTQSKQMWGFEGADNRDNSQLIKRKALSIYLRQKTARITTTEEKFHLYVVISQTFRKIQAHDIFG